MSYALLIAGAVLLITGVRNTQGDLFALLKGDLTGKGNFVFWIASIIGIGWVGYVPRLKPLSDAFLVLVIIVLLLSNKGFFAQWTQQINQSTGTTKAAAGSTLNDLSSILKFA